MLSSPPFLCLFSIVHCSFPPLLRTILMMQQCSALEKILQHANEIKMEETPIARTLSINPTRQLETKTFSRKVVKGGWASYVRGKPQVQWRCSITLWSHVKISILPKHSKLVLFLAKENFRRLVPVLIAVFLPH